MGVMESFDDRSDRADFARGARVGKQRCEHHGRVEVGHVADDHFDTDRLGPSLQYGNRLRMRVAVDEEGVVRRLLSPVGQGHCFGRSRGLIEQRGVGQIKPGQITDHGLKVENRLKATLADLWLVGRVGGIPGRVLQNVPGKHRRRDRAVVAHTDQAGSHHIPVGKGPQAGDSFNFTQSRRQTQRLAKADGFGHHPFEKRLSIGGAHHGQHFGGFDRG